MCGELTAKDRLPHLIVKYYSCRKPRQGQIFKIIRAVIIFYYVLQSLNVLCAIRVRRSNFSNQPSPRTSPRESTQRRKVELRQEMSSNFT
jgi:hypothetical protein